MISRRSMRSRRRREIRRQRRNRFAAIAVCFVLILGLSLSAFLLFIYNPMLERQLRAQFGDAFFSDFTVNASRGKGHDLDSIIASYEPVFLELEADALDRLEELFDKALEEYQLQERQGTLDSFVLTNKYIQAGRLLEKNVDRVFDDLLGEMKAELVNLGLPTTVTEEVKDTYRQAKDDKKRELFDRLRNKVGG